MPIPAQSTTPPEPMRASWVEALFLKLAARYGTLFLDRYAGVPQQLLIAEWSVELAGYTPDEIRRGLDGCRALKFPPTLPEFLALCRPPIDAHAAFTEAIDNLAKREHGQNPAWSHPGIYWAAQAVGVFDLKQSTYAAIKPRWERALADQMSRREWAPIPVAYVPLPPPAVESRVADEVRQKLRDLVAAKRMPT